MPIALNKVNPLVLNWVRYYYGYNNLNNIFDLDLYRDYPITNIELGDKWTMFEVAGIDYFIISKGKSNEF